MGPGSSLSSNPNSDMQTIITKITPYSSRWGDCTTDRDSSCEAESVKLSTCTTIGGPSPNKPCIFPFRHNGVTYSSCTTVTIGQSWCSTATRSDGSHISGRYGLCPSTCAGVGEKLTAECIPGNTWSEDCNTCICSSTKQPICTTNKPGSTWKNDCNTCVCSSSGTSVCTEKKCPDRCSVVSGPARGSECVFPFSFDGNTYQGCTPWTYGGRDQGKAWCSTK